jgi:hypothetical protein
MQCYDNFFFLNSINLSKNRQFFLRKKLKNHYIDPKSCRKFSETESELRKKNWCSFCQRSYYFLSVNWKQLELSLLVVFCQKASLPVNPLPRNWSVHRYLWREHQLSVDGKKRNQPKLATLCFHLSNLSKFSGHNYTYLLY